MTLQRHPRLCCRAHQINVCTSRGIELRLLGSINGSGTELIATDVRYRYAPFWWRAGRLRCPSLGSDPEAQQGVAICLFTPLPPSVFVNTVPWHRRRRPTLTVSLFSSPPRRVLRSTSYACERRELLFSSRSTHRQLWDGPGECRRMLPRSELCFLSGRSTFRPTRCGNVD